MAKTRWRMEDGPRIVARTSAVAAAVYGNHFATAFNRGTENGVQSYSIAYTPGTHAQIPLMKPGDPRYTLDTAHL